MVCTLRGADHMRASGHPRVLARTTAWRNPLRKQKDGTSRPTEPPRYDEWHAPQRERRGRCPHRPAPPPADTAAGWFPHLQIQPRPFVSVRPIGHPDGPMWASAPTCSPSPAHNVPGCCHMVCQRPAMESPARVCRKTMHYSIRSK